MTPEQIKATFDRLQGVLHRQRVDAARVDSWLKPELARGFQLPNRATREHEALADLSRTPWLRLVVDNCVQAMYVDSIFGEKGKSTDLWKLWVANGLPSLQISNHRAMVGYGHSYGLVRKAMRRGKMTARVRMLSPKKIAVEFRDDLLGETPSAALELVSEGRWTLYVPGKEYLLVASESVTDSVMDGVVIEEERATGLAYVPVVRFSNQLDLDGNVVGEVQPFIPSAARINKTSYDRLLAQHFNSWKVKTVTGLELPSETDEDGDPTDRVDQRAADQLKTKLAQDDILVAEGVETKFGTLDSTALEPFVTSWRADIEALAAVSQTPAHALTGQLVNLNAEALAAARAPLTQKVYERQMNAGVSYSRMLQIMAEVAGMTDIAKDDLVRVTWQDMEIRSMSQAADALGKIAGGLGAPKRGLWHLIPGIEATEIEEWERLLEEEYERDPLQAAFTRQVQQTVTGVDGGDY